MVEEKSPALVVLAAGLGSRYGGFKQIEMVGGDEESIMTFSIKDAIAAGFQKVVLIINKEIEETINKQFVKRFGDRIEISYCLQEVDQTPIKSSDWKDRTKPWGTAHAILAAKDVITSPFAVINADDFYGSTAFVQMKEALDTLKNNSNLFFMLGYRLVNTLSIHGGVSRGICGIENGCLSTIVEMKDVRESDGKISGIRDGELLEIPLDSTVSMNFWGFSPHVFKILEDQFIRFLKGRGYDSSAEFFITEALDTVINTGEVTIKVIPTSEKWFGVTYKRDLLEVIKGIQEYQQK